MVAFLIHLAVLWAIVWIVSVALYFVGGWSISAYANRQPERRIQARREASVPRSDEIRESLRSLVITSFCMALAVTLTLFGWTLWSPWGGGGGTVVGVVILTVGYDIYFYWIHRLLHTKPFIRFHRWHHKAIAPTVWSTDSQSPVETFMLQSFMIWAALLAPVAPLAFVVHRLLDHVNGQLGHCGYEFFANRTTRFPWPMVCTSYHDQHHELFHWNYGNYTSVWDRLHGTLHPKYDSTVETWISKTNNGA